MIVKFRIQAGIILCLLACAGCGPEAETGAVFSRYSAQACAAPSPADSLKSPRHLENTKPPATTVVDTDYLMGKFHPEQHPDFALVETPYTNRSGLYLRKEALASFEKMWKDAQNDGISLTILSATRTFGYQKGIWERKWATYSKQLDDPASCAQKILEYSSMPGSSRHHWGTDIDLNDLNNASFADNAKHGAVYKWLQKHAHQYGFYQPYTAKGNSRQTGYEEERWHWSYMPLAGPFLKQYRQHVNNGMISGFSGAETAPEVRIVQDFVAGVSKDCR